MARAAREAARLGVTVPFAASDIRDLPRAMPGPFDVVLSADNALAHFTDLGELTAALRAARGVLAPDGLFLASLRDYDAILASRPAGEPPRLGGRPGSRHASSQAWEWEEGTPVYRAHLFVMREGPGGDWTSRRFETRLRATSRVEFAAAAEAAGLVAGRWLDPVESGFYQPVFLAFAR